MSTGVTARITAERLVEHLEAAGFAVMRIAGAVAPTTTNLPI
jgi:Holliday junction resolvase